MSEQQEGSMGQQHFSARGVSLLPPPPPTVPADLTRATSRYKRHAWLAVAGLLAFVALYVSLTGWFCFTSARLFYDLFNDGKDGFFDFVGGALSGLLGVFLLGALLFIKSGGKPSDLEVTAAEEPVLFNFLNALADRARAPRPHRVFLSMRVNAAVFYDLSLVNLLLPSKKNLEIGLGLVNTLNLSEMTAVLAHEFGHFAQRSMAVGRWVYIAQQVAGQIVASRSWLDRALLALSQIDLRVAWIGWIMRIIVWSIRSLLDTAFGLVILAQRALGREMEFQADLVSVSLTGSDALVHALHRLGAADGAWSNALSVAGREAAAGNAVPDLFALQTRIIERMAGILNEPTHGASPVLPTGARHEHRVFEQELAEPPRMWSTHPGNRDREDNAKRVYVEAPIDTRDAFCLFANPEKLRKAATSRLIQEGTEKTLPVLSPEAALAAVDKRFERPHLAQRYRGAYLGRSIVLHEKSSDKLYGQPVPDHSLAETLSSLYPEALSADLRDLRQRQEERIHLEALRDGVLDAPGGVIRHRGRVIQRRALASVLAQVTGETESVRERVEAHDRLCRTSHRAAGRHLGRGWEDYLCGLSKLHHYAAHMEANLEDARGHLANVYAVVTADGRVTDGERHRLVVASAEVHAALWELFEQRMLVELSPEIMERLNELMGVDPGEKPPTTWADALPKNFSLPPPSHENIGDFLGVLDSWVNGALHAVGALERVSLELLVEAEAHVAQAYLNRTEGGVSPEPPTVPKRYPTLARGQERSRQKRLGWWDRFQTADGFFPSAARFVVAGGILASVLGFSGTIGHPSLTVVNGLGLPVEVEVQGHRLALEPNGHRTLALERSKREHISTRSAAGEDIEAFDEQLEGSLHYVYNVAGATALVEWTAVYGNTPEVPPRELGAQRWFPSAADVFFEQPPKSLSSKSKGGKKKVLSAFPDDAPPPRLTAHAGESERANLIEMHTLWDLPSSRFLIDWLVEAHEQPNAADLIRRRLQRYPDDMSARRLEQDVASPAEKREICARAQQKAEAEPKNLDALYLSLRCGRDDDANVNEKVLEAHRLHPKHAYLANAAGKELRRRRGYAGAVMAFGTASTAVPLINSANVELARLARITGVATPERLDALAANSTSLAMILALDKGDVDDGPEKAVSQLARGELNEAVASARSHPIHKWVLPLAAASDGASQALVDEALGVLDDAKDGPALWASIALAERELRPHPALDAAAQKRSDVAPQLLKFADSKFLEADPTAAEAELWKLPADDQPQACVMALVRVSVSAPAPCRELAKAALFASERPYFQ
ncbi:MAG TPA: M48 family metallopeptidase [Polyangiaceae bacterium]|nr:M48 family metallopeptidase [Polyangiaceae bacterium]